MAAGGPGPSFAVNGHGLGPGPSATNAGGAAGPSRPPLVSAPSSASIKSGAGQAGAKPGAGGGGGGGGGASDFVKKLYRMLEDPAFGDIVSWGRNGDSFVVKDMNDFTKLILPRHFKHSNFASFVRQLNKYDFHKVKNPEDGQAGYGEHTWEFRHPQFRADTQGGLDHIKRKAPASKKSTAASSLGVGGPYGGGIGSDGRVVSGSGLDGADGAQVAVAIDGFQGQLEAMGRMQQAMNHDIHALTRDYQNVVGEALNFRRTCFAQDQVIQNLIQYAVNLESDRRPDPSAPFVPSEQAQKLISSYHDVARAALDQMDDFARRVTYQTAGPGAAPGQPPNPSSLAAPHPYQQPYPVGPQPAHLAHNGLAHPGSSSSGSPGRDVESPPSSAGQPYPGGYAPQAAHHPSQQHRHPQQQQPQQPQPSQAQAKSHPQQPVQHIPGDGNLRVFTLGHLMPREAEPNGGPSMSQPAGTFANLPNLQNLPGGMPSLDKTNGEARANGADHQTNGETSTGEAGTEAEAGAPANGRPILRVRRGTYIPGWAVPPRVLLVEDDAVCRTLSSKFLQVFGCAIDVAVDGVTAVNMMGAERYDLVLMDIVMPNLSGVSATAMIRQFDSTTPIISMTSNAHPEDVLTYFDHGMNDILPKPFTKEGLLTMLEKHLMHMKAIQQMSEIPRSLGGDNQIQNILQSTRTVNPFADMGLSDADYQAMISSFIPGDNSANAFAAPGGQNKRSLDDDADDGKKRARFEELAS